MNLLAKNLAIFTLVSSSPVFISVACAGETEQVLVTGTRIETTYSDEGLFNNNDVLNPISPSMRMMMYGGTISSEAHKQKTCGEEMGKIAGAFAKCEYYAADFKVEGVKACSSQNNTTVSGSSGFNVLVVSAGGHIL